ncbi:hypothetical protein HRI_000267300 [Hibiscus trionum]|uniref:Uncharacterized protein n=1 Tax=Hibiscus trionum TaxID=183268 RepID=A0A9W7GY20_HIBTR|nr:hypothetical protein HRI_000267300 [Hibiscus trionum]
MAAGRLKPCPKFYLPFFLLQWLFSLGLTQAQRGYVNNHQLAWEDASKDNNITRGFSCNRYGRHGSHADDKNCPSRWAIWMRNNTISLRCYR